jgi:hypothetical protein
LAKTSWYPTRYHDVGLIALDTNTRKPKCKPVCSSPRNFFGRDPRLSATSMAAPLYVTSMIVGAHTGLAVCMRRHRNLPQTLELPNSSSHTFRSKAFSRFNPMRASSSSANSSVNLAKRNLHAHSLQVQNSIPFELETMSPFQNQTQDFV